MSEWSAFCTNPADPFSCTNALQNPNPVSQLPALDQRPLYAWTDMTYLLHKYGVSWGYYVFKGTEPDCENDQAVTCTPVPQNAKTPGIWNPLPHFETVHQDNQLGNVQTLSNFFTAAKNGTLPAVSWIDPNSKVSEHPTALVSAGQTYVTGLINAIMNSPDWHSTAIFLSWDDWGGFYDHVRPAADRHERLRPARARHRHQPVRPHRATSTTRRSATTPTTSSSRTTSSAASGSTRRPTAGPTPARTSASRIRCSATS